MSATENHQNQAQWLYVTAADEAEAEAIARTLVAERLVACANMLGAIRSFYWWEEAVQDDREVALVLKTRRANTERVIARVRDLHSYDCPCVVALDIEAGNPAFLEWIINETR